MSDQELVELVRRGDRRAFDELVCRHYMAARRIACRYAALSEDAEDIVQESFIMAYERLHQLKQPDRFAGWLASIVRNQGLMWQRRKFSQPELTPFDESALVSDNWEALKRTAIRDVVADAIAGLTAEQRQVVCLHYLDGCDYRETAMLLDIPVAAVRGRLDRARKLLKRELAMISEKGWELSGRDLSALRVASLFAFNGHEKPAINALRLEGGRLIATDTHRLFCYPAGSLKGVPLATIHADLGRQLQDHPDERSARLRLTDKEAVLRFKSGSEIRVPLVADEFPPTWEKVVPPSYEFRVTARAGDWLAVLTPHEGRVILRQGESSADGPAWEASASFPAEFPAGGKDLVIAVNSLYLEQAVLAQCSKDDDPIEFLANHELGAFTIRTADASGVFVVTMPMARDPVPEPAVA